MSDVPDDQKVQSAVLPEAAFVLSEDELLELQGLVGMVLQSVSPVAKVNEQGALSVAILANTHWGIALIAKALAAKYGVACVVTDQPATPFYLKG